jgi:hypothetical protein
VSSILALEPRSVANYYHTAAEQLAMTYFSISYAKCTWTVTYGRGGRRRRSCFFVKLLAHPGIKLSALYLLIYSLANF